MIQYKIDYANILGGFHGDLMDDVVSFLRDVLPEKWCERYRKMTSGETNILHFVDSSFDFLFDFTSELSTQEESAEDRVVAVYGKSRQQDTKRDASRIRGFLGGPFRLPEGGKHDKGHFIGHVLGGGLDVNLFPQRTVVNRGWSETGKTYRAMERYCAKNVGTFCFSCPLYGDRTWIPTSIEYGLLVDKRELWVELFDN